MNLTFIIPTRGRTDCLFDCISSVVNQTYIDWRCVIVDDNDDLDIMEHDGISALVNDYSMKVIKSASVVSGFPVHNFGIRHSDSEILFRLDDDVILDENFVTLAMPGFENPKVVAIGGVFDSNKRPFEKLPADRGNLLFFNKTVTGIEVNHTLDVQLRPHSMKRWISVDHIFSSYLYRRSAILEIGGFNETIRNREETIPFLHWGFAGYQSLIYTGCYASHKVVDGGWRGSKRLFHNEKNNLEEIVKNIFSKYNIECKDGLSLRQYARF